MEKHGGKQCVAVIENCIMTAVGLRHLFMNAQDEHRSFQYFRNIAEFTQALRQTSYDAVMFCLSGTRDSRIECLYALGKIARDFPDMVRVILANDRTEMALIKHLSPTYIHGVLSKACTLLELQQEMLNLLSEAALGNKCEETSSIRSECHFLSPTENMILRYMTYGYSLMEISQRLGRNIKTIRAHKFNAMTKLGVSSDVGLLSAADLLVSLPDRNTAFTQPLRSA